MMESEEAMEAYSMNYDKHRKLTCLEELRGELIKRENPRVLDIGCGTGCFLMALAG